jgi:biotin carboxyl carrier protein
LTLDIGSQTRFVRIVAEDAALSVTVDGRQYRVDARSAGDGRLSLLVSPGDRPGPVGGGPSYEASVTPLPAGGAFEVGVAGHRIPVALRSRRRAGIEPGGAARAPVGPLRIVAPMPGKIVRVLVRAGDDVKARQGLVVVEAMKMENELRASGSGRVRQVVVQEGQSVEAGALLVELES